jgi:hypothetical protein
MARRLLATVRTTDCGLAESTNIATWNLKHSQFLSSYRNNTYVSSDLDMVPSVGVASNVWHT